MNKNEAFKKVKLGKEVLMWFQPLCVYVKITKKEAIKAIKNSQHFNEEDIRVHRGNCYIG